MENLITYPMKIRKFKNDYKEKLKSCSTQFSTDITRSLIRQKNRPNVCPVSANQNSDQTLSDAPSLKSLIKDAERYDMTADCFLDTLVAYFESTDEPSAAEYCLYLHNTYDIPLKSDFSIKF